MKEKKRVVLLAAILFFVTASLGAADFGLLLNQSAGIGSPVDDNDIRIEYTLGVVPRLSFLIGDTGSFFTSAGLTFNYRNYKDETDLIPELMRTEYSMRSETFGLSFGRINYSDPLAFITNGLFDGIHFSFINSKAGRFGLGAWYTGLLYKETTTISMTPVDNSINSGSLDFEDFANTYFAPKRFIAAFDWEHPSVGEILQLSASLAGQVDLNDTSEKLHTEYFILKMGIPVKNVLFELGGSIETAQIESLDKETVFNLALAGEFGIIWTLPAKINSQFSFKGRYTSGKKSELLAAFNPITTNYYGEIFQAKMTGITSLGLNYSARISQKFGTSLNASYFVRNDLVTPNTYPINEEPNDEYFLGGEFFASFIWSPVSDLQFRLGAGAFIPAMGNVWQDANAEWRVDLSAILAIF